VSTHEVGIQPSHPMICFRYRYAEPRANDRKGRRAVSRGAVQSVRVDTEHLQDVLDHRLGCCSSSLSSRNPCSRLIDGGQRPNPNRVTATSATTYSRLSRRVESASPLRSIDSGRRSSSISPSSSPTSES